MVKDNLNVINKWVHEYDVDSGLSDGYSTSDKKVDNLLLKIHFLPNQLL